MRVGVLEFSLDLLDEAVGEERGVGVGEAGADDSVDVDGDVLEEGDVPVLAAGSAGAEVGAPRVGEWSCPDLVDTGFR